jgi:antagonist of KipI
MLHVIKPGLLTTIQDRGRWGYQAYGMPVAGPMDDVSHRIANAIVGNRPDRATLEVTLIGPELEFEDGRAVAVAGADFDVSVDGHSIPRFERVVVNAAARLRFGPRRWGSRAYVAIEGGIDVPPVFGSRATHVASRIGGIDGRALAAGDRLPLGAAARRMARAIAAHEIEHLSDEAVRSIRIMAGPNQESFATEALDILLAAPYIVGIHSDRMGFRLEGAALGHSRGGDIISEATPLGAIQVPSSGQPILLMADRQTTGGYPKLATVVSADIHRAGQLGPGDRLSFAVCTRREAVEALLAQERVLASLEARATA